MSESATRWAETYQRHSRFARRPYLMERTCEDLESSPARQKLRLTRWSARSERADARVMQETGGMSSSYSPVVIQEDFASVMSRISAAKPAIMQRQKALLEERYDLSDR